MTSHGPEGRPPESSDHELLAMIQRSAEPVVVESYHAGWEKPWRGLSPKAWSEILREFGKRVNGAVVETGKSRELATRYELEIIPTVLVFSRGEAVARFTGSVRVADVIGAIHTALQQARTLESARQELKVESMAMRALSRVCSLLHVRASETSEHPLAASAD